MEEEIEGYRGYEARGYRWAENEDKSDALSFSPSIDAARIYCIQRYPFATPPQVNSFVNGAERYLSQNRDKQDG